jgi:predicted nuclease of restriction endonuclease-like (RecB) superfamily
MYWDIGKSILDRQKQQGWGAKVVNLLSADLTEAFPEMKGFSPRNLKYMRMFAREYPDREFVQAALAQITWYHNITLLTKVKASKARFFYATHAAKNGWSTSVMVHQIESDLFNRQGKAVTNFPQALSAPHSQMAQHVLKDPYNLDFLTVTEHVHERDIERQLVEHIKRFLLELGVGFAFVGNQYRIELPSTDIYLDLLFFHLRLRSYIVVDLKARQFMAEDAGKMNMYLSAVDDKLRHETDNPSIGLIICKSKDRLLAEYALRDMGKPIGVSSYQLTRSLPRDIRSSLPTIEQIESELGSGEVGE